MSDPTKDKYKLMALEIVPHFVNTHLFSEEAKFFIKNGYYDCGPKGTYKYTEYWDEQTRRCLEGYSVGGVRITGLHYFYLNFCRIKATVMINNLERKVLTFPKFLDMDYYYFHELENARRSGQGLIAAKARRKGFSYKNGALCAHQYHFYRDSNSIIGAYLDEYAQTTMDMTLEMLNFIDTHTAWTKRRNPNRMDLVKARFKEEVDGIEQWSGYNSQIMTLTFKDNASASIGKTADLFLFEEAGKFPNLIDSYMLTAPVFRDGDIMIGMPIIFGTGGDMEGSTNNFAEMFYNPTKYWLRPFDNIWDEGAKGTEAGFFIDDMWYKPGKIYMPYDKLSSETIERFDIKPPKELAISNFVEVEMVDEDGNSNREAAEYYLDKERENLKKSDSRRTWEKYITQSPKTPREAFLRVSGNIFPVAELNILLGELETNNRARKMGMAGELYWEGEKVKWRPNPEMRPIMDFPLKSSDDKKGCIVIYEIPYKDMEGNVPYGLYIAGTDPYDQDSSTTDSLGSTIIYKTFQNFDKTYDIIVAEYTGRPDSANEYYENVRKLLTYYGCKTLYENNLKGLKVHMEQKRSLHLLKEQPAILADIVKDSNVKRGFGVHMTESIKRQAEIYVRDWLLTKKADGEDGKQILNLNTLNCIPLVKELIAYNKDGNFDRVIAFMLVILHMQENHNIQAQATYNKVHKDSFWTRQLFVNKRAGRLNSFR